MGKYVEMIKRMGEMTLAHSENVMRVTEGLCNGGIAIITDANGKQTIVEPTGDTVEKKIKSLQEIKSIVEANGQKCSVHTNQSEKERSVNISNTDDNMSDDKDLNEITTLLRRNGIACKLRTTDGKECEITESDRIYDMPVTIINGTTKVFRDKATFESYSNSGSNSTTKENSLFIRNGKAYRA